MTTHDVTASLTRFEADGFLLCDTPMLPADLIRRASEGMDALRRGEYETGTPPQPSPWKPGDPEDRLCKIEQPQFANLAIRELIGHPVIGEVVAAVTGAEWVQTWWVQLLFKPSLPPGTPAKTRVGWHQDRTYWGCWEPGSELLTAWVALSEAGPDSGPMKFVVGSHHWGLFPEADFFSQEDDHARIAVPTGQSWQEVAAILPPGGFSLHDDQTLHGSGPNTSGISRRSFAIHMRTNRSRPVDDKRQGLTAFIDDPAICPILYKRH
ncbi:MAG TPA: phytanoyl-CoA dioxygenase family protein [Chthonomonadaceae bacterium]|nr:phytanoyl-CoA dioxygenase family protein [Chthonomonadaceae bacterium]